MNELAQNRLKILYLIDELITRGGTEKHLYELATGMAEKGHEVTIFSLNDGPFGIECKKLYNINYECLNISKIYDLQGIKAIMRIYKYIIKHSIDIIQTFHTASDLIGPIAASLSANSVKIYSSRRDLGYTKLPRHLFLQKIVNNFVDGILANSTAVKQAVITQERVCADKITVINNGIDVQPFMVDLKQREVKRLKLGITPANLVIGSVGNIRPVKGYDLLVEAAGIVCRENPNVLFYHVGEGEMKEQLETRCKDLGIGQNFRFLGATKEVPSFLSVLDIYVQPSRSEGMSNAILEAMAARLPVLATDVGGNSDLIEHDVTGMLVPAENSELMAVQLQELVLSPQLRDRLAEQALKQVIKKFQISSMVANYAAYYSSGGL